MRRAYRPTRRYRRRRTQRRANRGEYYRRWCYTEVNLLSKKDAQAFHRITFKLNDSSAAELQAAGFHKYRIKRYSMTCRPAAQLDSSTFSFLTASAKATTYYDPFSEVQGSSVQALMNAPYGKQHSPRYIKRAGRPVLSRVDIQSDEIPPDPSVEYKVTVSPWISTNNKDVPHYLTSLALPTVAAPDAQDALSFTRALWVLVEYAGHRTGF